MPVLRTAETADTEEYKYHAGAENGCSTGRKAFRIGRIYLQTGKEKIEANDYGRTIGYYSPVRGNDYVTGWLVCVKGPEKDEIIDYTTDSTGLGEVWIWMLFFGRQKHFTGYALLGCI